MNKRGISSKLLLGIAGFLLVVTLLISINPSGFLNKITGFATSDVVSINISISGANNPNITVNNITMTDLVNGPTEGPSTTGIYINFTVYDGDGFTNLDVGSFYLNLSRTNEVTRVNQSCINTGNESVYYSTFNCTVTMYWYDGSGDWIINASIADVDGNFAFNDTSITFIGTTDGFVMSPNVLTFTGVTAGGTNIESIENITLNNTGNVNKYININATNLRGEIDNSIALWGSNFTVNTVDDGCEGIALVNHTYTNITSGILNKGNFTIQNLTAGQEEFQTCLEIVGNELIAQQYSTGQEGSWTIQIVTNV